MVVGGGGGGGGKGKRREGDSGVIHFVVIRFEALLKLDSQ